jgi:hypothetical protein
MNYWLDLLQEKDGNSIIKCKGFAFTVLFFAGCLHKAPGLF